MKRCKVCNAKLILTNDRRYLVCKDTIINKLLTQQIAAYECFDCPKCGCQNIVNVREGAENELISTPNGST